MPSLSAHDASLNGGRSQTRFCHCERSESIQKCTALKMAVNIHLASFQRWIPPA